MTVDTLAPPEHHAYPYQSEEGVILAAERILQSGPRIVGYAPPELSTELPDEFLKEHPGATYHQYDQEFTPGGLVLPSSLAHLRSTIDIIENDYQAWFGTTAGFEAGLDIRQYRGGKDALTGKGYHTDLGGIIYLVTDNATTKFALSDARIEQIKHGKVEFPEWRPDPYTIVAFSLLTSHSAPAFEEYLNGLRTFLRVDYWPHGWHDLGPSASQYFK